MNTAVRTLEYLLPAIPVILTALITELQCQLKKFEAGEALTSFEDVDLFRLYLYLRMPRQDPEVLDALLEAVPEQVRRRILPIAS